MDSPEELEEKVAPQQFVAQGDHSSTQEIGDRTSPPRSLGILESDFLAASMVLPNFQSINAVGHIRVLIGTYAIIYIYTIIYIYMYIFVVIPGYCLCLLTNVTFAHGISWKSTCVGRCPIISIEQSVDD